MLTIKKLVAPASAWDDSRSPSKEREQPCPRDFKNPAKSPRGRRCPRSFVNPPRASALVLTFLALILFNGCTDSGPRALLQGERLLREGKSAEAIQKLERASSLLPKDARA